MPSTSRAAGDDLFQFVLGVEIQPHRNAETIAQRVGQETCAGGRAHQCEFGEIDLHRTGRRPLTDDEVELEILHRGIEHLLYLRTEAMDFVDEQHIAFFEIGQQRREIARLRDHRAGGRAEAYAKLARNDLRQRGLLETGRADKQHVIERSALARGIDEDLEIGASLRLPDEFRQVLRTQRSVADIVGASLGRDNAGCVGHAIASARPCGPKCQVRTIAQHTMVAMKQVITITGR